MIYSRLITGLLLALLLCGCGSDLAQGQLLPPEGDPTRGRQLFHGEALIADGNLPSCVTCHADTADGVSVLGPNLSGVGSRAASTVPGEDAATYLRRSLLEPDAYLAGGFQEGIMYREYPQALTQQDVDDLVAYLLTLK